MHHHPSSPPPFHGNPPASRARPIFVAQQPPVLVAQQPPATVVMVPVGNGGFRALPAARAIRASSVPAQTVFTPSAMVNLSPSNAPLMHVGSPPGVHTRLAPGRRF